SPVPSYLKNTRRRHYLSCLRSGRFDLVWVSRLDTAWAIGEIGSIPSVLDLDDLESSAFRSKQQLKKGRSQADVLSVSRKAQEVPEIEKEISLKYDLVTLSAVQEMN